jgi:DedD protein
MATGPLLMGLFSIFQQRRNTEAALAGSSSADEPTSVEVARTRARRRLIGATVLVLIGVVGFPLVFETQPRPIPVNVAIDIPRRDGAAPLPMPATRPAAPQAQGRVVPEASVAASAAVSAAASAAAASPAASPPAAARERESTARAETRTDTRNEERQAPKPEARSEPRAPAAAASRAVAAVNTAAQDSAEAARARAILEGRPLPAAAASAAQRAAPAAAPTPAGDGRFVVQVGAFADPEAARQARSRVERIGLRTYVQDVEVGGSKRTRVRVGPFSGRDEADRVAAKIKAAGITAAVLTL